MHAAVCMGAHTALAAYAAAVTGRLGYRRGVHPHARGVERSQGRHERLRWSSSGAGASWRRPQCRRWSARQGSIPWGSPAAQPCEWRAPTCAAHRQQQQHQQQQAAAKDPLSSGLEVSRGAGGIHSRAASAWTRAPSPSRLLSRRIARTADGGQRSAAERAAPGPKAAAQPARCHTPLATSRVSPWRSQKPCIL